jgi:hypothetical protein
LASWYVNAVLDRSRPERVLFGKMIARLYSGSSRPENARDRGGRKMAEGIAAGRETVFS